MGGSARPRVRVGFLSRDELLARSRGEVTSERGLYDEAVFGRDEGHGCACGAVRFAREPGGECSRCGGVVGETDARAERFGHVALAEPVVHPWLLARRPSPVAVVLGMRAGEVERVAAGEAFVVLDGAGTGARRGAVVSPARERALRARDGAFRAATFAPALEALWREALEDARRAGANEVRARGHRSKGKQRRAALRAQWTRAQGALPATLLLDVVLVPPPGLRGASREGLDARYAAVLAANERARRGATADARRALWLAVRALFVGGTPVRVGGRRARASLARLADAQAKRAEKRVDASGAAVVAPDASLGVEHCGLPVALAAELFAVALAGRLVASGAAWDLADAREIARQTERADVRGALEALCRAHRVVVAREEVRVREDVASFAPALVDGRAVRLHPSVAEAFGGRDATVRVLLPSSVEARADARGRMSVAQRAKAHNDAATALRPRAEALLGLFFATRAPREGAEVRGVFASGGAVEAAYEHGALALDDVVLVRGGSGARARTTVGRALVERLVPAGVGFDVAAYALDARRVRLLFDAAARALPAREVVALAERLWRFGAEVATRAGVSLAVDDLAPPASKAGYVAEGRARTAKIAADYVAGEITDGERYNKIVDVWADIAWWIDREVARRPSAAWLFADVGAGTGREARAVVGARGLVAEPSGAVVELPVVHSLAEGLDPHECAVIATTARRAAVEAADREAGARGLRGALATALEDVTIVAEDCGTTEGFTVEALVDGAEVLATLAQRALGRRALRDVRDDRDGATIVRAGELIDAAAARRIETAVVYEIEVRSALGCRARGGVCRACHGGDARVGDAVGLDAALALAEPVQHLIVPVFHIC